MNSFEGPIVLLAGGRDKELPWEDFAQVVAEKVDHLILFGEARDKIARLIAEFQSEESLDSVHQAETLSAAVDLAIGIVEEGDVVLLAPGGTSFDQYVDFAERGDEFRFLVESIT
jgi:UDP-N-acetylmuramoylalanine--D-glutamate ligase